MDPLGGGRRRSATRHSAEDQALDQIAKEAEARLAAKRQARAEAREIRMRELEKQQQQRGGGECGPGEDAPSPPSSTTSSLSSYDHHHSTHHHNYHHASTPTSGAYPGEGFTRSSRVSNSLGGGSRGGTLVNNSYHSSRRSSEDSLDELATSSSLREVRQELREVEDKFRKAMIGNAQLDNEKSAAAYQVELYKDRFEELEEEHAQLQREYKDKCRRLEQMKRDFLSLQKELEQTRVALLERDKLIQEQGLVIVGGEGSSSGEERSGGEDERGNGGGGRQKKRALVSVEMAALLDSVGQGSLDVRLKRLASERNELLDELRHVKLELEEERARGNRMGNSSGDLQDAQREANKQLGDYKFKLQKAEQDISTLQATVARLEGQVVRYKTAAETAENLEDELKSDRRKLQRELREAMARLEELETSNTHLQRRLDKLKNAKSALLKDL